MENYAQIKIDFMRAAGEFGKIQKNRDYAFCREVLAHIQLNSFHANQKVALIIKEAFLSDTDSPVDAIVKELDLLAKKIVALETIDSTQLQEWHLSYLLANEDGLLQAEILYNAVKHDDDPTWEWLQLNSPVSVEDYYIQTEALAKTFEMKLKSD